MSETTQTAQRWRFDNVGARAALSDEVDATTKTPRWGSTDSAVSPGVSRFTPTGFVRRWKQAMRSWTKQRLKGFGGRSLRFEEILHEFAQSIGTASDAGAVEAALLRQAQRTVPACRVELAMGMAPPCNPGDRAAVPSGVTAPSCSHDGQIRQAPLEVPLRCGPALYGWLRIRSRTSGATSVRRETVRRLTTLCTLAACALERLSQFAAWPEPHDAAEESGHAGLPAVSGGSVTGALAGVTDGLHDATFLNAVLPFALNQARRHHEPLSLLCVAIDRLAGIQELLGHDTADHLVNSVAGTLASLIRASDIIARLDDDRVVAVLPRAPGGGALHVAEKVCLAVAAKSRTECAIPNITVSIGVATFPGSADNVFSLFDAADEALARAQTLGRNRACPAPRRATATAVRASAVARSS
jgi:diguanylate cyclase (GGDEF)-like protein